jgi:hypothetical protein
LITTARPGFEIDEVGEVVMTSDAAVAHAIATVFERFAALGSARQVLLWWQRHGLKYPVRRIELRAQPVKYTFGYYELQRG